MPRRIVVAVLAATTMLLVACSGDGPAGDGAGTAPSAAPAPDATPVERPGPAFPQQWEPPTLRWEQCSLPSPGECATLEVPLDWDDPDGATIGLRIGRIPGSGDVIGPLAMNPGGPGGSGLDFLAARPVSPELARRFDLISWDPRGVGESQGLSCGAQVDDFLVLDPDPDNPAESRALTEAASAIGRECAVTDGELLAHVHTAAVANDLEAIRRSLGDAPINYLGFSYGTRIGQEYLARFPHRVRTMVLDGVVDTRQGFEEFHLAQTAAFDAAFEAAARECRDAGPATCGVDDLAAAHDQLAASLDREALRTQWGEPVTPATLATAAILTTYQPGGWQRLGPALADALDGDPSHLWSLASQYHELGNYPSYAAVVCTDTVPPQGADAYEAFAERAREVSPRFGGSVANEMLPCATWPAEPVGLEGEIRVPGAPPVLVIGNTGDAATPYENATQVASVLGTATLITVESDGHTAYGSNACTNEIVDRYFIDLVVPEGETSC